MRMRWSEGPAIVGGTFVSIGYCSTKIRLFSSGLLTVCTLGSEPDYKAFNRFTDDYKRGPYD